MDSLHGDQIPDCALSNQLHGGSKGFNNDIFSHVTA